MTWQQIGIYVLFFIGLYYIMIMWPRKSQEKRHRQMINDLAIGSRVVTIGGIYGKIAMKKPDTDTFMLEVSEGVIVEVSGRAISHRILDEGEPEMIEPVSTKEMRSDEE